MPLVGKVAAGSQEAVASVDTTAVPEATLEASPGAEGRGAVAVEGAEMEAEGVGVGVREVEVVEVEAQVEGLGACKAREEAKGLVKATQAARKARAEGLGVALVEGVAGGVAKVAGAKAVAAKAAAELVGEAAEVSVGPGV